MFDTTTTSTSTQARRQRHWEMLCICVVVLLLAFSLNVDEGESVYFAFLAKLPVPQTCFSRQLFGYDCPGCGLTRSYIYLAEGEWIKAWSIHRVGWLMFALTVLQIPYRLLALVRSGKEIIPMSVSRWIGIILIGLLFGNWLFGVIFLGSAHSN